MQKQDNLIEVSELVKRFANVFAVNSLSFSVKRGDVLGFLGPNGAGKTTTMRMIAGFLMPSHGYSRICGFDVTEKPIEVKKRLGYLPEGAPSYGEMTVRDYLFFVASVRMVAPQSRSVCVDRVVQQVELGGVFYQKIETLSKGFQRRVALAQALIHDPDVLVMDEPTDGLDPNQKYEVRNLISQMSENKAIIISTHILEEVSAVCSRAIIIARGEKLFDDTSAALQERAGTGSLDSVFRHITIGKPS